MTGNRLKWSVETIKISLYAQARRLPLLSAQNSVWNRLSVLNNFLVFLHKVNEVFSVNWTWISDCRASSILGYRSSRRHGVLPPTNSPPRFLFSLLTLKLIISELDIKCTCFSRIVFKITQVALVFCDFLVMTVHAVVFCIALTLAVFHFLF